MNHFAQHPAPAQNPGARGPPCPCSSAAHSQRSSQTLEAVSVQVVRPSQLPFPWPAPEALEVPAALLWMLTFQDNHGHLLGEHGPSMHALLCTHLGR